MTDAMTANEGRPTAEGRWWMGARGVLSAATIGALVLLAGLVVAEQPGRPDLRTVAADGGCGGWSEDRPGFDESVLTVAFLVENPSAEPVTIRGTRMTWDAGLKSVRVQLARPIVGVDEGAMFGYFSDDIDADHVLPTRGAVIPANGSIRVAAEMHLWPGADSGHLTGLRFLTDGPLGTLRTETLPVGVGMMAPDVKSC
ncbi:hypothetical protein DEJ32_15110 [Curtobacterium sp. MCPF17_046]|nr:hypothetical protein DEJ32_15110 [Curtobacterium sp. MCPF17_046]